MTVTGPLAVSLVLFTVGTEYGADVAFAGIVTILAPVVVDPRNPLWYGTSATVRFTTRFAFGAGLAVTVKDAAVPSVTGEVPAEIVITGCDCAAAGPGNAAANARESARNRTARGRSVRLTPATATPASRPNDPRPLLAR